VSLGAFCSKEEAEVTTSRTHRGENGNGLNWSETRAMNVSWTKNRYGWPQ
jgi:hypothetical protein